MQTPFQVGSPLAIRRYQPSPWSMLCHVKLGLCPHTQSTLCQVLFKSHLSFCSHLHLDIASCTTCIVSLNVCTCDQPITSGSSPVMSLCSCTLEATSFPLKTTQAMSHKLPVDLPIRSECLKSTFIEVVMMRTCLCHLQS